MAFHIIPQALIDNSSKFGLTYKRIWDLLVDMKNTIVKKAADEFGMSVDQFLKLFRLRKLPGQLPSRSFFDAQDSEIDLDLKFNARTMRSSPAWKRIKRMARFNDQTVRGFVTYAIMEAVRGSEEVAILSPRTGEPICRDWDIEDWTATSLD